jgi:hypothetical protein
LFKILSGILIIALLLVWRSFLSSVPIVPQEIPDSFLYANKGEIEEGGGIMPTIEGSFAYGANIVPEYTPLASILPETLEFTEISPSASFEKLPIGISCQCVDFIKEFFAGLKSKQLYNPAYIWKFHDEYSLEETKAEAGALVIMKNHIAVVEKVLGDQIQIVEKNHIPCTIGRRIINIKDVIGFLK